MKLIITFLVVLAFIVGSPLIVLSQNAEQLYQKGLMQEEGEGNLQEAINIYNQIVQNESADISIRAKALLHVGLCYEKMGKEEATKAYQKLVNNFPSQKNEVAIARERLSKLILAVEEIAKSPLTPRFTKIEIASKPQSGVLSPDGDKLAFMSDGAVWIVPLHGDVDPLIAGEPVRLANVAGLWEESGMMSWSANGKWIAVYGGTDNEASDIGSIVSIIPVNGGKHRIVHLPEQGGHLWSYFLSLSPDAQSLAFSAIKVGEKRKDVIHSLERYIYTISTKGDKQIPQQVSSGWARFPSFSRDGKFIAYVGYRERKEWQDSASQLGFQADLWIAPSSGGTPHRLASFDGQLRGLVWSPNNKYIAAHMEPGNSNDSKEIWLYPVSLNTLKVGEPGKIKLPGSSWKMLTGWTPKDELGVFIAKEENSALYTVPVINGKAVQVTSEGNWPYYPRWSPNGKNIYYREVNSKKGKVYTLSIPAMGGDPDFLDVNSDRWLVSRVPGGGLNISPDGKKIVISAYQEPYNPKEGVDIWATPTDGSKPTRLTYDSSFEGYPCWSPNGKKIAFVDSKDKTKDEEYDAIFIVPSEGGEIEQVTLEKDSVSGGAITFSPDGKQIAFFSGSSIKTIPVEGGQSKILVSGIKSARHSNLAFSPDGLKIAHNAKGKIWINSLVDGKQSTLNTGLPDNIRLSECDWSPDGEKIVFVGSSGGDSEFWLMEDFLPLDKLAQNKKIEAAKESEGIVIKQVWTGSNVDNTGKVSLDGKYLSFVDWETGDLAVRDLVKRENERVTNDGKWEDPYEFADLNVISPDGKQIAYQWYSGKNSNLKIIDINTKLTKTISTSEDGEIYPSLWITETEQLIAQRFNKIEDKYNSNLSSINIKTGEIQVLRKFERKTFMSNIALSPDGQYVAFDFLDANMNDRFDINLVSIDGNEELSFIKHPANDRLLGWLPNSNKFLFTSNRTGTSDIWAVKSLANNSVSEPKRILTNVGNIKPLGFSFKGTLYYSTTLRKYNSYVIPNNQNSGELLLHSKTPLLGTIGDVSWLPDSNIVLCVEFKRKANNRQDYKLCLLNPETNEKHKLTDKIIVMGPPRLSPDNNLVLTQGWDENRIEEENYRGGIYTIELSSGNVSQINAKEDVSRSFSNEWSKDGKFIFYTSNNQIIKHEISTGEEHIIYSNEKLGMPVIRRSFEGNSLIFDVQMNDSLKHLKSISVNGGNEELLAKFNTSRTPLMFRKLTLSPNGKYIYFSVDDSQSGSILWRILAEGGEPVEIWHSKNKIAGIGVHPNGGKMAISLYEHEIEIRKIENLANEVEKIYSQNE